MSSLSMDCSPRYSFNAFTSNRWLIHTDSSHQTRPVAPIDALPDELLLYIFTLGAEDAGNDEAGDATFSFLVSTICQSWRSLAINESRLWTSLTVTLSAAINRLPVPAEEIFDFFEVFPKECTILQRSANRDFDFYLNFDELMGGEEKWLELKNFNEVHLFVLSDLIASHAHRMRRFDVTMLTWESVVYFCSPLHGITMPRLDSWGVTASDTEDYSTFEHTYDQGLGSNVEPMRVLEYDDLQGSHRLLLPALKYVSCSGIPLNWELFSPSNLQTLVLGFQPRDARLSMETLRGILWNSKDTLEHLQLLAVLDIRSEVPVPDARLVLKYVTGLALRYTGVHEARALFQGFEFPELRTLVLQNKGRDCDDEVLLDVLKYTQVEDLFKVQFSRIFVDCLEGAAGGTAEESTPLILQLFHRFSRGDLQRLTLDHCCECFLKFMNYGNEMGGGSVNLSQLKALIVCVTTTEASEGVVSFLRDRLELGSVNGPYAGPVLEQLKLMMWQGVEGQVEALAELAKEIQITYR
ncbi:hypothetical protein EDD18DRAFT_1423668 [Armillaria luteobubalina]|uniref:F-box domain-containing protein n=1 Tax=Armillaria luteobubalina TaxID=153913 RepID=A0AA39UHU5_9AGAR|nr:hypothetical protein EDD18DRAFT_1423668 [Armillaria luteobubalina]